MTIQEIIARVRFLLGELSTEDISDETLTMIIMRCQSDSDNDTDCKVIYCTIMETLQHLIRMSYNQQGSDAKGSLKRLREEEYLVEYETEYYNTISDDKTGWEKLYDYFIQNPEDVCSELSRKTEAILYIGGVSKEKVREVEDNQDSNGPRVSIGGFSEVGRVGRIVNSFGLTRREAERRRRY